MNAEVMQSWAVEALIASSLLILLVLLVRGTVQRLFGARVAYALWALPLLRMMLPRVPGLDAARLHPDLHLAGLFDLVSANADSAPALAAPAVAAMIPATATVVPEAARLAPTAQGIDWPALLLVLWLGGAVLHLGWHILAHRRFLRRIKADAVMLRRDCGISIWTGPAVPGPLATGLVDRAILLPADFTDRYAPRERRLVLAHEVAHHCRGDLFANAAALALLSLHWFNPLAHRAYRLFRADQELACDETVLADEPADARFHYGRAIVKSVAPRFPAAACAMHSAGLLKQRLRMMTRMSGGMLRLAAGGLLGAGLMAGGLALTASGAAAASDIAAAMPVPPVPPVPGAPLVTPPAPPAPPAPIKGHHHVMISDRAIIVDGRTVDPASPEGREIRREADRAAREGRRAAAQAAREAEREAREAHREALADSLAATAEARRAGLEAARAAREAAAHVDARGIVRASLRSARTALEADCPNGRHAARAIADDRAAIKAIAANCVDKEAIRAEVRRGLVQAKAGLAEAEVRLDDF